MEASIPLLTGTLTLTLSYLWRRLVQFLGCLWWKARCMTKANQVLVLCWCWCWLGMVPPWSNRGMTCGLKWRHLISKGQRSTLLSHHHVLPKMCWPLLNGKAENLTSSSDWRTERLCWRRLLTQPDSFNFCFCFILTAACTHFSPSPFSLHLLPHERDHVSTRLHNMLNCTKCNTARPCQYTCHVWNHLNSSPDMWITYWLYSKIINN